MRYSNQSNRWLSDKQSGFLYVELSISILFLSAVLYVFFSYESLTITWSTYAHMVWLGTNSARSALEEGPHPPEARLFDCISKHNWSRQTSFKQSIPIWDSDKVALLTGETITLEWHENNGVQRVLTFDTITISS